MTSNDPRDAQRAGGSAQTPPPSRLSPGTASTPAQQPAAPSTAGGDPTGRQGGAPAGGAGNAGSPDPLRGSRASGFWATVVVLVIVLVLLAIFVLQNTRGVEIRFLGWNGSVPLAAAMMISAAAGLVLAVAAGTLRILQLRRRVKRDRKLS